MKNFDKEVNRKVKEVLRIRSIVRISFVYFFN